MSEATIELRYLAESQPSLCIPRVFNNINESRIRKVFDDLSLGKISRVDIKERRNEKGETFKRVYVHFDKWFWNEDAQAARRKLVSGKEIKIVYDNPWFWKVSASKWLPTADSHERAAPQRPRAHIDFEDSEPRSRVTDEFGRDLRLRNEERRTEEKRPEERRPQERRPERLESRRPERVQRPERPERVQRHDERRPERLESRRPETNEVRLPIAPTLTRKSDKLVPRSPSSSPPRSRTVDVDEPKRTQGGVLLDYGHVVPPKKRNVAAKKPVTELVVQEPVVKDPVVQEQEPAEEQTIIISLSDEDRKACEEMYGDL
jgi:hypothetical protein